MKVAVWLLVLAGCAWALFVRPPAWLKRPAVSRAAATARARFPDFEEYRVVSPLHLRRAQDMLARFAETYQHTFGACERNLVVDLHEQRSRALASLYELRMRLPNDVRAYDALTEKIERVERSTLIHIDDVTQRCQMGLLHLSPVGDHYYSHRYRAANDTPQ